jgi:prefoldin subunit 5
MKQFIEDVEKYMSEENRQFESVMRELQGRYEQMKNLERALQSEKIRLTQKIPEIQKSLDALKMLDKNREENKTTSLKYQLGEASIYAKADVEDPSSVFLWLGANVMLEYPLSEAKQLLENNLENCKTSLVRTDGDLAFVKDNATIQEVNLARVYNWDVKKRTDEALKKVKDGQEASIEAA